MSDEVQMNMVEILSEELGDKELKIMALEKKLKEQENITKKFMKDTLIKTLETSECFIEEEYQIDIELKDIWEDIIEEMNDRDWNGDDHYSELYIYEIKDLKHIQINLRLRECNECGDEVDYCTTLIWRDNCYWCQSCYKEAWGNPLESESESDSDSDSD